MKYRTLVNVKIEHSNSYSPASDLEIKLNKGTEFTVLMVIELKTGKTLIKTDIKIHTVYLMELLKIKRSLKSC